MFDAYIICGTPRTGSTLLCDLLTSTKRTGAPHSFYRRQNILEWAKEWKLPDRGTMSELDFISTRRSQLAGASRASSACA